MAGYDCSGLVQEFLSCVGLDPKGDQTAQTLFAIMKESCTLLAKPEIEAGGIVFFGHGINTIEHVAFAVDERHMIEAGGGGRTTRSLREAIAQGAFVRVRPIESRQDFVACLLPKY